MARVQDQVIRVQFVCKLLFPPIVNVFWLCEELSLSCMFYLDFFFLIRQYGRTSGQDPTQMLFYWHLSVIWYLYHTFCL